MFANRQAWQASGDGSEGAANLGRGVGFQVPHVEVRGTAQEIDEDTGSCPGRSGPGVGGCYGGSRQARSQATGDRQTAAHPQELPAVPDKCGRGGGWFQHGINLPFQEKTRAYHSLSLPLLAGDSLRNCGNPVEVFGSRYLTAFFLPIGAEKCYSGAAVTQRLENLPMPSPFPGMDPYIEACDLWADFHQHLIAKISEHLADVSPERYLVRTGEPPILSLKKNTANPSSKFSRPIRTYGWSPASKCCRPRTNGPTPRAGSCICVSGKACCWGMSTWWRSTCCAAVNAHAHARPLAQQPVCADGGQGQESQLCQVWPTHSLRPLSPIPIPLAKPDPAIMLNLQPIIDGIYQRYRYERSINYRNPLSPALSTEEAAFLDQQLRTRAKPAGR